MKKIIENAWLLAAMLILIITSGSANNKIEQKPNIVVIFTDDQGYSDVGVFGAKGFETPNIDQIAKEGMKFTDFYVAAPACSPSRAALLTGCYPQRVGIVQVLWPDNNKNGWDPERRISKTGINKNETTIAEMLKSRGYATGCFGKWHLGHHKQFLPIQQGFDEYYGFPYSNDMRGSTPLIKGNDVIEMVPRKNQWKLTTSYTNEAIDFITKHTESPFFVYLAHTMPHVPLYVSDKFKGHSKRGIYGDVIEEIDWSVGQINKTLKDLGLDKNTLVVFTCDNGPWLSRGTHGGTAEPLREGKGTTFEGGMRVPCVMKWPNVIAAGSECIEIASTMDLLPTFANITGSDLPSNKIDGHNIIDLMSSKKNAKSPTKVFYFYKGWDLEAVRYGKWKLHFPHAYTSWIKSETGNNYGVKGIKKEIELSLFDLSADIGEHKNVAVENPKIIRKILKEVEKMKKDLGDGEEDKNCLGRRDCGWQKQPCSLCPNHESVSITK